jgi:hypothetical protein
LIIAVYILRNINRGIISLIRSCSPSLEIFLRKQPIWISREGEQLLIREIIPLFIFLKI